MTEPEAMALMTGRGFQEEGEAAGKWRRALLTSAQLSTYYVGYTEVSDLAAELRRDPGPVRPHGPRPHARPRLPAGPPAPRGRLAVGSAAALPGEQISEEARVTCGDLDDLHAA